MVELRKINKEIAIDPKKSLKTRVEKAFASNNTTIYKREHETQQIQDFLLKSKDKILNIVGVPGTGKTSLVLNLCRNIKKFRYLNFYKVSNIKKELLKGKYNVVAIDEFDKFYERQEANCKFVIHHLTSQGCKLIALGNNLEFKSQAIVFKPYTSQDIEEIVKAKIEKEIEAPIISNLDLKILCRKYSNGGDMRAVFKFILNHFDPVTGIVSVDINEDNKTEEADVSIHHKIIIKLGDKSLSKVQSFRSYFAECEEYGIPPLSRRLFYELYDTLCYK